MTEISPPSANDAQSNASGTTGLIYTHFDKHYTHIVKSLKMIHEQQLFVDVILISSVDGIKVNASKIVLSSFSHYFFSMFSSEFQESKSGEVTLDFDGDTLNAIVKYIYTASIKLDEENVERILVAADFFQMNELKNAACSFMEDRLEPGNCLLMALMANRYSLTTLFKKSLALLNKHFSKVRCESEFFNLSLEGLNTLLKEDCFTSQEELFGGLVSWVQHDMPGREQFLCKLLKHVRFNSLTLEFICKQAESVSKTIEFYELMIKWINWHVTSGNRSRNQSGKKTRTTKLICVAEVEGCLQVQSYDPELKKWSLVYFKLPSLWPSEYSTIALNELIFFIGWYSGEVLCLNRKSASWEVLPSMNEQRIKPGLAELNGYLYAVGGQTAAGNWLSSVEKFDIATKTWKYITSLSSPVRNPQVVVLKGQLHVVNSGTKSMEIFDSSILKWKSQVLPTGFSAKKFFAAAALNDVIVFILKETDHRHFGHDFFSMQTSNSFNPIRSLEIGRHLLDEFVVYGNGLLFINKMSGQFTLFNPVFGNSVDYTQMLSFDHKNKYKLLVTVE